ncbi:hypothetical protein HK104_006975, partial [Borealophlyctis nickersoniae]
DTDSNSRTHYTNESKSESEFLDLVFDDVLDEMSEPSDRTVANTGSSSGTAAQHSDRTVANTGSRTILGPSDRTVTAPIDKGNQREETNGTGSSSTKRKPSNTVTNEKAQKKLKT